MFRHPSPLITPSGTQGGPTPLYTASLEGHIDMAQTLMAAGADVSAKTDVSDGTLLPMCTTLGVEGYAFPHPSPLINTAV